MPEKKETIDNTRKILRAVLLGKKTAKSENEGGSWSTSWNKGAQSYQDHFRRVFEMPFAQFIEQRSKQGKGAYVFDLMGQGQVLRELPIQGGLALSLGDGRNLERIDEDTKRNVEVLTGNVLRRKTWQGVGSWLQKNGVEGFDLILCRPDGGLYEEYIPENVGLYYTLLNKAWNVLSKDGGALLTQVPPFLVRDNLLPDWKMGGWVDTLNKLGVEAVYDPKWALKLVRSSNSPNDLPNDLL